MNLYGIYDVKAGYFLPLLEASTDEHAERIVADAIRQGNQQLLIHQNDYLLYCICQYDNKTGMITQDSKPDLVTSMSDLVKKFSPPEPSAIEEMMQENNAVYLDTPLPDDS